MSLEFVQLVLVHDFCHMQLVHSVQTQQALQTPTEIQKPDTPEPH